MRQVLADAELDPRRLVLELTESTLMEGVGDARTVLPALVRAGRGLAIDDFGTGYSSLSYLKHFPVNTLKIDKSFIRDVTSDPNDAAITSAIVAMGHALDLRVVAEGVETEAQVELLRKLGCDMIQGHWVSRPMTADDFAALPQAEGRGPRRGARARAALALVAVAECLGRLLPDARIGILEGRHQQSGGRAPIDLLCRFHDLEAHCGSAPP